MENLYLNSMILRNLGHNKANYRDHLGAPPMSDADDVAFAIAEKLLQKEVDRKMWDFHNQLEKRRAVHSSDHHSKNCAHRFLQQASWFPRPLPINTRATGCSTYLR